MTLQPDVRVLESPTEQEIDRAAWVLTEAFRGDKFVEAIIGDKSLLYPFRRAQVVAAVLGGEVHVAGAEPGTIDGVALWFGPGQDFLSSPDHAEKSGWKAFTDQVKPETRDWWGYLSLAMNAMVVERLGVTFQRESYLLFVLGIAPSDQKKGLGRALLEAARSKAAKTHSSLILSTVREKLVPFYESNGYSTVGQVDLKHPDGFKQTVMVMNT